MDAALQETDRRSLTMSEIMTPEKANFAGNIHGGYLLQMLDRVAYACAARYANSYVVTLSVDHVVFKEPIYVGELVTCFATVNYVGKTSLVIGIKVIAEELISHKTRHTNSCYFTMVALDENQKPTTVPPLTIRNHTEQRRFEEAELRREMRKEYEMKHQQRKEELRKKLTNKK